MTLTCWQDHILIENIWFVWSKTSYSGDERRCYRCGTNNNRTLKIELLSQWKLEAEFRNLQCLLPFCELRCFDAISVLSRFTHFVWSKIELNIPLCKANMTNMMFAINPLWRSIFLKSSVWDLSLFRMVVLWYVVWLLSAGAQLWILEGAAVRTPFEVPPSPLSPPRQPHVGGRPPASKCGKGRMSWLGMN